MIVNDQIINVVDLGVIEYQTALDYQKKLFNENLILKRQNKKVQNTILICQHNHVITLGKNGHKTNLLLNEDSLNEKGVSFYLSDRGGDITYHGPGQLVVYPIIDLDQFKIGLKQYVWNLEQIIINILDEYNIKGERIDKAIGIWIDKDTPDERKICALGIKSSSFITMHGLAFNISTDLSFFNLINPCGFENKGTTSLENELGCIPDINLILNKFLFYFEKIFTIDSK